MIDVCIAGVMSHQLINSSRISEYMTMSMIILEIMGCYIKQNKDFFELY